MEFGLDLDDDGDQYKDDFEDRPERQQLHLDADQVFNQQRALVAKLSRAEIEDRYLRLLEENVVLKKHACKQVII